ncbi:lysylphosphatidylglycerol synthase transmembrane domain-containing protein [Cytophagaceae bacterium ABcell3]|nr:lysylphosphatidylglycerol synthase transmembrane domain-containing protein [Cytophagaceae bacterium ABcell3]
MASSVNNIIKYSLSFVLAIGIFWYVLGQVDISSMMGKILAADFKWVALALCASLLSHVSRAYRWRLLLEPINYKPSTGNTFLAVMTGYFANLVLPRMGEVSRCVVLTKTDKIPFNASFGTVVAERAFDLLCLIVLLSLAFLMEIDKFGAFFVEHVAPGESAYYILSGLALFGLIALIIIYNLRTVLLKNPYLNKLFVFLKGVWEGVVSISKIKKRGGFILHTVIIWTLYYLMSYLVFFSMEETAHLGIVAGMMILVIGGIGMSAPVQGGIGVFHEMVSAALLLFYGIAKEDGLAYAFVVHTSQLLLILIVGGICFVITLFKGRKNNKPNITAKTVVA